MFTNSLPSNVDKTPKSELDFAKNLKKQYFIDKKLSLENEKGINKKNKR